ncbi:MBL fold metallo-hydrolase [Psychromarinibacter sp. C21-152]|uniref:MBL fold metallo-hydrolase n=1 Tax=Psychromarinibacter sediminicola TaxID=3033385 RepID=A0AAE3NWD2_9RHOB|nr:MBL fold metallo-hydrolase [Psychromarinibacter sediminicola]MDF0603454.1 MBL fold metallo-hydrolase [Psychromarinibacter sediminicola]
MTDDAPFAPVPDRVPGPVRGRVETPEPGLRRLLAPNPSPMTERGTNTYIVGEGRVAVIDPGPDRPEHLAAIRAALASGETVSHILVTHAHRDHSGLAPALAQATGAPVLAFGRAEDGRSELMQRLAAEGLSGGGEGLDRSLTPDRLLSDGDTVSGDGWTLTALWTPGHAAGHLCFAWGNVVFSGDTVMGWASTMVSPPDGDLTAFMASTERLAARGARVFYPGHGAAIPRPAERCAWLLTHRRDREAAILAALDGGGRTPAELTRAVYRDTPAALMPAAERNVLAHLIDLAQKNRVRAAPRLSGDARFHPV